MVFADVVDGAMKRSGKFSKILLVQEDFVLLEIVSNALALGNGDEVVLTGASRLYIEEVGSSTCGNALGVDLVTFLLLVSVVRRVVSHCV